MNNSSEFSVTILGNASAIPTQNSHPTSQLVIHKSNYFLVDCGEGTQIQLIRNKIKYQKIDNIFISHMHGDHFFGLIGLISTYHLLGRDKPLHIYGPGRLKQIIENLLEAAYTKLKYELIFHCLESNSLMKVFENEQLSIFSFPLVHRIPTWGFTFKEKPKQWRIKKSFVEQYKPSIKHILEIKNGKDYIDKNHHIIQNDTITHTPLEPLSYAYCSDTKYDESIIESIKDVTLLYHEATFDSSMQDLANQKFHSTAKDAATMAKKSNAGSLLLGHFSARYKDLNILLKEAMKIFEPTIISEEGMKYYIG